jgi:hypothetical protein
VCVFVCLFVVWQLVMTCRLPLLGQDRSVQPWCVGKMAAVVILVVLLLLLLNIPPYDCFGQFRVLEFSPFRAQILGRRLACSHFTLLHIA